MEGRPAAAAGSYVRSGETYVSKGQGISRQSISEFAGHGYYEWTETERGSYAVSPSYAVDAGDVLARFLRAVASYIADERR